VSRFAIWSPTDVTAGTDGSRASLDVSRQAKEVVQVTYTEVDGSRRVASLDRELFDEVACRQVAALNEARGGLKERAAKALALEVDAVLSDLHGADRVRKFADWYYGYSTAYELLRVGIVAAAASLPSSLSAREAAGEAVAQAVLDKYLALVLRPAVLEPALRRGFERAGQAARSDFVATVEATHAAALPLLREQTSHLDTGGGEGRAALAVDWRFARAAASQLSGAHDRSAAGLAAPRCSSPPRNWTRGFGCGKPPPHPHSHRFMH